MSAFLFDTDAAQQNYNLIAPAGHSILAGNGVSYSYQGNAPSQVIYVYGQDFTYQGNIVVSGTPDLVLGTDNGWFLFEARLYGVADPSIQHLSTLSTSDQFNYLSSGADYFQANPSVAHTSTLVGGAGDDLLDDGPGQTSIDGGTGTDTAHLHFNFTDASFSLQNGVLAVTAPGFQDRIVNVEQFQFNDRTFDSLAALENAAGIDTGTHAVYRFYDTVTNDHFYTLDPSEAASIRANLKTFTYEGTPWSSPDPATNTENVYRFYDTVTKTHFLTESTVERDSILKNLPTFTYEGVAFQAYTNANDAGAVTLERFYNSNSHVHTYALVDEAAQIRSGGSGAGWVDEGPGLIVHAPQSV